MSAAVSEEALIPITAAMRDQQQVLSDIGRQLHTLRNDDRLESKASTQLLERLGQRLLNTNRAVAACCVRLDELLEGQRAIAQALRLEPLADYLAKLPPIGDAGHILVEEA